MTTVLDASAALAVMLREPGGAVVRAALTTAAISAVNVSEVFARLVSAGVPPDTVQRGLKDLGAHITSFDEMQARSAGELRSVTKQWGLSLGDRACIALAQRMSGVILTSDRDLVAAGSALGIDIRMIR